MPDCTTKSDESITIVKSREDNNVQIKAKVHCNCPHHTTWELIKHEQKDQHNETTDISYVEDLFKCKKVNIFFIIIKKNILIYVLNLYFICIFSVEGLQCWRILWIHKNRLLLNVY